MDGGFLVVEDQPVVALDIEDVLNRLGYRVAASFGTVDQALSHVRGSRPDAAVMDIEAPGSSVFQLADTLDGRRVPFLFVSSDGPDALPPRFRTRPCLPKPFETVDLVVAVTRLTGVPSVLVLPKAANLNRAPWRPRRHAAELRRAELHVVKGRARIARVEKLLGRHPTPEGERLLAELRRSLDAVTQVRDLIRDSLDR